MNINEQTMQEIKKLADLMGVSAHDVKCLALGIANDLKKDNVDNVFINSDESMQNDFVAAYGQHQVKKYNQFVGTYLTNPNAQEAFQEIVLNGFF